MTVTSAAIKAALPVSIAMVDESTAAAFAGPIKSNMESLARKTVQHSAASSEKDVIRDNIAVQKGIIGNIEFAAVRRV